MPGRYNYPLSMSDRISQRITFQPMEVTPPQFTPGNKTGFITRKTFDDLFSLNEADRRQAASDYVDAVIFDLGLSSMVITTAFIML